MSGRLERYKPAAPVRLHLLLAALLWTVVGALLLYFGARWTWEAGGTFAAGWLVLAVVVGLIKARFVLHRTATRAIARIRRRGDGRCIGGFLSWQSWLFVALMMVVGRILRGGLVPHAIVGFIYAAVGTALLAATGGIWRAWRDARHRKGEP